MSKFLKWAAIVVGCFVALIVVAVIVLTLVVNPNDYKGRISEAVKAQTGRNLVFEGDISMTFFPWLGVKTGPMALSNAPGFEADQFARIQAAKVSVKILPLLLTRLEMDTVTVDGLKLNLERNQEGKTNWSDLSEKKPETGAGRPAGESGGVEAPLTDISIDGVRVNDAMVSWNDRQADTRYELDKLFIKIGAIRPHEPIAFDLSFQGVSQNPPLTVNPRIKGVAVLDPRQNRYQIKDLNLDAKAAGDTLPGKEAQATVTADVDLDLNGQTLKVDNLKWQTYGVAGNGELAASDILKAPQYSGGLRIEPFNPRELLRKLNKPEPETADKAAFSEVAARMAFQGTGSSLDVSDLELKLDQTSLTGKGSVKNFDNPVVNLSLKLDELALSRYLPPEGAGKTEPAPATLKNLNLTVAQSGSGQPIVFDMTLDATAGAPPIAIRPRLSGAVVMDTPNKVYQIDNLRLKTALTGETLPDKEVDADFSARIKADFQKQTLDIQDITLALLDLKTSGRFSAQDILREMTYAGTVSIEPFNLKQLLTRLGQQAPQTADKAAFSAVSANLSFTGTKSSLLLEDLTARLDQTEVKGKASVKDFQNPALDASFRLDKIDVSRYLPPEKNTGQEKRSVGPQSLTLSDVSVKAQRSAGAEPIVFDLALQAVSQDPAVRVAPHISGAATIDTAQKSYRIDKFRMDADVYGDQFPDKRMMAAVSADIQADLSQGVLMVKNLSLQTLDLKAQGDIAVEKLSAAPVVSGSLGVAPFNLKEFLKKAGWKVPPMADGSALGTASAQMTFSGGPEAVVIKDSEFVLDQTHMKLNADVKDFKNPVFSVAASLDAIEPWRYLASPAKGAQESTQFRITNFSVSLDRKNVSEPLLFTLAFDAFRESPALSVVPHIAGSATLDIPNRLYQLNDLTMVAAIRGQGLPEKGAEARLTTKITADLAKQTLAVSQFQAQGLGVNAQGALSAEKILDKPSYSGSFKIDPFSLRKLMTTLGLELPQTADPTTLETVAAQISFSGADDSVLLKDASITLDQTNIKASGSARNLKDPSYKFALSIDDLDADRYLPPPEKPQGAETGKPAPPAEKKPVDLEPLRKLRLEGDVAIGKLKIEKIRATDVKAKITAKDGVVKIDPVRMSLYQGTSTGALSLNARNQQPEMKVVNTVQGLQAGPLLNDVTGKDRITGLTTVKTDVTAQGTDAEAIKKTLNGTMAFKFENGAIKGVNVAKMIRDATAVLQGKAQSPPEPEQTDFAEFSGTLAMTNGVATNDDMVLKSPLLRIHGKGTIDLARNTLDYLLSAAIVGTLKGQGGESMEKLSQISVPLRVTGSLSDPRYSLDTEAMAKMLVEDKLKQQTEGLQKSLEQKLFGTQKEQAPATGAQEETKQKSAPAKPEDLLKGLLKGFGSSGK